MRLAGERRFDAPRELVWEAVSDPLRLAELVPAVRELELLDDDRFRAELTLPLALGGLGIALECERLEQRRPAFSSLAAHGRAPGTALRSRTSFSLARAGAGTRMRWEAELSLSGAVGAVGTLVLAPLLRAQIEQVLSAVALEVASAAGRPG